MTLGFSSNSIAYFSYPFSGYGYYLFNIKIVHMHRIENLVIDHFKMFLLRIIDYEDDEEKKPNNQTTKME